MSKPFVAAAAALALLPLAMPAAAQVTPDFVGARASTLGLGGEFGVKLTPHLGVRAVANGLDIDYDTTNDNIHYNGQAKLSSYGVQLDYRFFENGPLFVTAGLYSNKNRIDANATPTGTTNIGGVPYTPAQIGTLTARAKYKESAPYLGLGGRWPIGHVEFTAEAGAYFQGHPAVTLTSNGTFASNTSYQQAQETERKSLEDDLSDTNVIPALTLGLRYKF